MSAARKSAKASKSDSPLLFVAPLQARWRDLDAYNHVNNATYLTYLEEARLQWLRHLRDWFSEEAMPVLAASQLNYRQSIAWPANLNVQLRCDRLGNSSVTLGHRIVDADDETRVYCDGDVVVVWVHPDTGTPAPLPASIREAAEAAGAN